MNAERIHLTEAEWRVMECLWERSPQTGREITQEMEERVGWSRSTALTMLSRLTAKGVVAAGSEDGKKMFYAILGREDAALQEAEGFLSRVYHGSVSMMVSALTKKQKLSQEEIRRLYAMLEELEGGGQDG